VLGQLAKGFPVLALTGPRQSGKTTLARQVFPDKPYYTFEDLEIRQRVVSDPRQFFTHLPDGAVLDEVQRCPEIFSYLQGVVDERSRTGEFVITGSQQFGLVERITLSLAGRVGLVQLLPLSLSELTQGGLTSQTLEQVVWMGGYPALFDRRRSVASPGQWLGAYTATYVERDVPQLLSVANSGLFQRFVLMCAARTGQLLNLSALAADCGISHTTARSWMTVLQARQPMPCVAPYSNPGLWPKPSSTVGTWVCLPISISGATTMEQRSICCLKARASCTPWRSSRAPRFPRTGCRPAIGGRVMPAPWRPRPCWCTVGATATPCKVYRSWRGIDWAPERASTTTSISGALAALTHPIPSPTRRLDHEHVAGLHGRAADVR
jgi:hypothetical protein